MEDKSSHVLENRTFRGTNEYFQSKAAHFSKQHEEQI